MDGKSSLSSQHFLSLVSRSHFKSLLGPGRNLKNFGDFPFGRKKPLGLAEKLNKLGLKGAKLPKSFSERNFPGGLEPPLTPFPGERETLFKGLKKTLWRPLGKTPRVPSILGFTGETGNRGPRKNPLFRKLLSLPEDFSISEFFGRHKLLF